MEALIELVSAFPILYDPKHQDYLRLSLKERIWEHISRKLNLPSGEVAKTNWRKLRDAHRVALRRQRKKKSDNGDSVIRPWVFQKNMEFLLPFMPNYSGLSDLDSEDHGFQETGNVNHIFDDYASIENELNSTLPQKKSQEHNDSFDYTCLEDELPPDKLPSPRKKSKTASKSAKIGLVSDESLLLKTLKNLEERAAARDSLRQTIKSNMSTPHRHSNNDPLYSFFVSMYNTTKNFPVRHQLEVRREVFNLITKIEESVLMGGDVASNSSVKNRQHTVSSEYDSSGIVSSLTTML